MQIKIKEYKKNAIIIKYHEVGETIQKGKSKIGGKPDLPPDFKWYTYKDEVGKIYPLSFIAQINLEEIQEYDKDKILPDRGMLYFFYELKTMNSGFSPKDKGCAKVFYYNGDISKLNASDLPKGLPEECVIPEFGICFETRHELPFCEEYNELTGLQLEYDEYNKKVSREKMLYQDEELHKLLGYADLIQGSMLVECEMICQGIYCGGFEHLELKDQYMGKAKEWQLLFQMDMISNADYQLSFYDCGRIYYYIKKEDLEKKNFEDVWLMLQSY